MQHTHMQKAKPIEAKKLLSRRMESDYSKQNATLPVVLSISD